MFQGVLSKMRTNYANPVDYYLVFENNFLNINQLIDKKVFIQFVEYKCLSCKENKTIYRQGFCRKCFFETPEAADWVLKPELSKAHLDIEERDLDFEKKAQLQPHIVYLANSGGIKVGVTRKTQVPTRWIDQGAHQALAIAEVPNRYLAGVTEVALKEYISDKTNWRKMLQNIHSEKDLETERDTIASHIPEEIQQYLLKDSTPVTVHYPSSVYPQKPKSLNLTKTLKYEGVLKGVKGQYLIFEDSTVFNVRAHEGFVVKIIVNQINNHP